MGDTRLPKCVMFGELVGGAGCVRAMIKSGWGVSWAISGFRYYRRLVGDCYPGRGAEGFMAKWIAAAELRHAVVCPNATGRTEERIAQNKRARVGSLVIVDQR